MYIISLYNLVPSFDLNLSENIRNFNTCRHSYHIDSLQLIDWISTRLIMVLLIYYYTNCPNLKCTRQKLVSAHQELLVHTGTLEVFQIAFLDFGADKLILR